VADIVHVDARVAHGVRNEHESEYNKHESVCNKHESCCNKHELPSNKHKKPVIRVPSSSSSRDASSDCTTLRLFGAEASFAFPRTPAHFDETLLIPS
jgi:hypothetical protein